MAFLFADRVRVNTTSTGTGTINLGTAVYGFRTFATAVAAGSLTSGCSIYYVIEDIGGTWEIGSGVYTAGTPDTLSRTVVASSLGGTSALNLSGSAQVCLTITSATLSFLQTTPTHGPVSTITSGSSVSIANGTAVTIINKTSGSPTTVTLPTATNGEYHTIKDGKGDASTNNITITPTSGTIDGATNFIINVGYQSIDVISDGTNWYVM